MINRLDWITGRWARKRRRSRYTLSLAEAASARASRAPGVPLARALLRGFFAATAFWTT